ncbi:MAG TPA: hypothetical protein PK443_04370 [bacterium]|nr:hypothetical protein [bacterium]
MKNIILITLVGLIVMYAYIAVNEREKEKILSKRVPQIKKVNKYDFSRALYQIRETRKIIKEKDKIEIKESPNQEETPSLEDDLDTLERLRLEQSNPAMPIDNYDQYEQEEYDEEDLRDRGPIRKPIGIKGLPPRFKTNDENTEEVETAEGLEEQKQPTPEEPSEQ